MLSAESILVLLIYLAIVAGGCYVHYLILYRVVVAGVREGVRLTRGTSFDEQPRLMPRKKVKAAARIRDEARAIAHSKPWKAVR